MSVAQIQVFLQVLLPDILSQACFLLMHRQPAIIASVTEIKRPVAAIFAAGSEKLTQTKAEARCNPSSK
jgi:hypothetical protein